MGETMNTEANREDHQYAGAEQGAFVLGPWQFVEGKFNREGPHYGCSGSICTYGDDHWDRWYIAAIENAPQAIANTRLIAAAPEMLAALRNVQKIISEAAMTGFNCHDGDWPDRLFFSQQMTSAAIAKATSTASRTDDAHRSAKRE